VGVEVELGSPSMFDCNIMRVGLGVLAVLAVGSAARLIAVHWASKEVRSVRLRSPGTWWVAAIVIVAIAILGKPAAVAVFTLVSIVALQEFLHLRGADVTDRWTRPLCYGLVAANYLCLLNDWPTAFIGGMPAAALILLSVTAVLAGGSAGCVRRQAEVYSGFVLTTYLPGYSVLLFCLPEESNPIAGAAGWFMFLLLVTETSDIAQALVGRPFGRKTILPRISPHKTWLGLAGGIIVALLTAWLLSGWLTPWDATTAIGAGVLICLTGICGDLNISAIKRNYGVKDASNLLPGQGGMLDRIDSLSFAAPVFYWYVVLIEFFEKGGSG